MIRQNYVSEDLTHFVGSKDLSDRDRQYNILKTILKDRVLEARPKGVPRLYVPNDRLSDNTLVKCPMVCFCDIPPDSFGIHMKKYGVFGLAFLKAFLIPRGAQPVIYFGYDPSAEAQDCFPLNRAPSEEIVNYAGRHLYELIESLGAGALIPSDPGHRDGAFYYKKLRDFVYARLLGYIKVFDVNKASADDDPNNYYMEREWRIVQEDVRFEVKDVHRVILPASYEDQLRVDCPEYNGIERIIIDAHGSLRVGPDSPGAPQDLVGTADAK